MDKSSAEKPAPSADVTSENTTYTPENAPVVTETLDEGSAQKEVRVLTKKSFPGVNLYVKNLDDTFTDEKLREVFKEFGSIISTKMMYEGTHPKGFGFVCFATQEEAQAAVAQMNGRIVGSKPLYVTYAQKKEDRKAFLAKKYKEMGESGQTVPPILSQIPPSVKSPISVPPASPIVGPQQTYFPIQTSPQNMHFQYYPAGHVVSPQLPWNPVQIQQVHMTQPYYAPQNQYNTIPVAQAQDASSMQNAPAFMWTGAPNTGYMPYTIQQQPNTQSVSANVPSTTIHAGPNYMQPQNVFPGQQIPANTLPSNIMTVQNYPKVIEQPHQSNYNLQQQ